MRTMNDDDKILGYYYPMEWGRINDGNLFILIEQYLYSLSDINHSSTPFVVTLYVTRTIDYN